MNNLEVFDKTDKVNKVFVAERFSTNKNSKYYVLVVQFVNQNGQYYELDTFLNQDKKLIMDMI